MILTSRRATLMMLKNFIQTAIIIKIDKERGIQKNISQCDVILLNWLALWDRFNSFVCCTFYTVKFILFVTTNDKKKCLEIKRTREIFLIRSLSNKKLYAHTEVFHWVTLWTGACGCALQFFILFFFFSVLLSLVGLITANHLILITMHL